jgi:hypothetical protein
MRMNSTIEKWPKRFAKKIDIRSDDECWVWTACSTSGTGGNYGMYWHEGRMHNSHRMALVFCGHEIPENCVVMHKCDNPPCCNPKHLKVGDQKDNIADAHAKNRAPIGETHGMCILTEDQVLKIRDKNETAAEAAVKYGVSRATINDIRQRVSWRHI